MTSRAAVRYLIRVEVAGETFDFLFDGAPASLGALKRQLGRCVLEPSLPFSLLLACQIAGLAEELVAADRAA